jgi:hypothetical protein
VHPKDLAGLRNLQDEGFAFSRGGGQLHPALAQHVNSAGRLAFYEKYGPGWIRSGVFNPVECFEGPFGKGTKKTVAAELTDDAVFHQFKTVR